VIETVRYVNHVQIVLVEADGGLHGKDDLFNETIRPLGADQPGPQTQSLDLQEGGGADSGTYEFYFTLSHGLTVGFPRQTPITAIPQPVEPIAQYICAGVPDPLLSPPRFPLAAYFGYNNPNHFTVTIPIGEDNRFTGQGVSEDEGQPETFWPGEHLKAFSLFRLWSEGEDFPVFPAWTLDGTTVQHRFPEGVLWYCDLNRIPRYRPEPHRLAPRGGLVR
jgi:hypothetical protein